MQVLRKPIISCGGKTGQLLQQVPSFCIPISWHGCWAVLLPGTFLVGAGVLAEQGFPTGSSLSWLWNQSCCSLWRHRVAVSFPVGMHGIPLAPLAALCLPASPSADVHTAPCWQTCHTLLEATLTSLLVCSLFSTAWKDILILYAYRKCGELLEHLLFINLASYCCVEVINGKTEAQSN